MGECVHTMGMTDISHESPGVYCPACGYDLRAAVEGGRCPECGRTVVLAELVTSHVPWVMRHVRGWRKTFFMTWCWAFFRPGTLGREALRPQAWHDARRFARIVAIGLGLILTCLHASVMWADYDGYIATTRVNNGGFSFMFKATGELASGWQVPFLALLDVPWVLIPIAFGGFGGGMLMAWWTRMCFASWAPRERKADAACIGLYSLSAWLVPLGAWTLGVTAIAAARQGLPEDWQQPVVIAAGVFGYTASIWFVVSKTRTLMFATNRGVLACLIGVAVLTYGNIILLALSLAAAVWLGGLLVLMMRSVLGM